jgi:hypothetical protein
MLDLIIGMASGYIFEDLEPFAVSLSRSGFKGECVLITGEGPKDEVPRYGPLPKAREDRSLEQMLSKYGITVWNRGEFKEHPSVARQAFVYEYVSQKLDDTDLRFVLCTDVKDVVFQSNPIDWLEKNLPEDKDIVVISENQTYGTGPMVGNNKNMVEAFGEEEYKKLQGKWIVNGGVFAGRARAIRALTLLNYNMCLKDKRREYSTPDYKSMLPDQSALNILIRDELFKDKVMMSFPIDGFAFGHPLTRYSTFKDDGKMYPSGSNRPYHIFHQYFDSETWWRKIREVYKA